MQCFLPPGFKFEKKGSRCVSFLSDNGPSFKGTSRSKEAAVACMSSWAWSWWHSLSDDQRSAVRSAATAKRASSRERSLSSRSKRLKTSGCWSAPLQFRWSWASCVAAGTCWKLPANLIWNLTPKPEAWGSASGQWKWPKKQVICCSSGCCSWRSQRELVGICYCQSSQPPKCSFIPFHSGAMWLLLTYLLLYFTFSWFSSILATKLISCWEWVGSALN